MTFFSICLGENHQRVQESLVSMGTICFPPLYYIDIHLLQKLILIRRVVHDIEIAGVTKTFNINSLKRSLYVKLSQLKEALDELDYHDFIKWTSKKKTLVH